MRNKGKCLGAGLAMVTALSAGAAVGSPASARMAGSDDLTGASARSRLADHYTAASVRALADHEVVVSGLDNPRQLVWDNGGGIRIAEAGHGSYKPENCVSGGPEGETCIGRTGKISRVVNPGRATDREPYRIARGFLSGAAPDGTFAVGSDGVDQGPLGRTFVQETYAPPDVLPQGTGGRQSGKLLTLDKRIVANISAYEFRHNPDGEDDVHSNPYAVLALKEHQLVADAGADAIIKVRDGKKSLWTVLPGDTDEVDPVPTSIVQGPDNLIYVGTLYSLQPDKARVLQYSRDGELLRTWRRFTSVTGVAVGKGGALFVSELFGGCPPDDPNCIPGRVVRIAPDGTRTSVPVPFPAGLVVRKGNLFVNAWSIAPAKGAFGNPEFSGQVWRFEM